MRIQIRIRWNVALWWVCLVLLCLPGCQNDVRVDPNDQSDEVFCIDRPEGDRYCCPEFEENTDACWIECDS